jgi:hypothetical protein
MRLHSKPSSPFFILALLLILVGAGSQDFLWAQTSVSQVSAFSLRDTNGQKIVAGPGGLHVVFVSGSAVKYLTSTNGSTWSAPVGVATVAINASRPTIAVAGNTIGVAYVKSNYVYYTYKLTTGNWSAPFQIWSGDSVAMVGYGSTMHLAVGGFEVKYFSFPANSPSAAWWPVGGSLVCGSTTIYTPAIAVMRTSASNSSTRVRVAYFKRSLPDSTCPNLPITFGLWLYEKLGTGAFVALISGGGQTTGTPHGVSTSLAANNGTGEFYLAASYVDNGASTFVRYQDVWNNGPWQSAQILATQGLIDIAAASCGKFRIAVSDIVAGNGMYGPTWYRSGQWLGVNPTWTEPQGVQVTALGRDPQALFWTSQSGLIHREIHALFEESSGTSYFVKHNLATRKGPALYDCRSRNAQDEMRDVIAYGRR